MEFTDDYVYVNGQNCEVSPDAINLTFPLGLSTDRAPDRKGTCLALLSKLFSHSTDLNHYGLGNGGMGKLVFSGNLNKITLYVTEASGAPVLLSTIPDFSLVLKISRPKQDTIQPAYRAQIPL